MKEIRWQGYLKEIRKILNIPFESLLFSILLVFSASGSGSIPSINIFLSRALLSMAGFRWSSKKSVSPEGKSKIK